MKILKQIIVLSVLALAINATVIGWIDCGSHLAYVYRIRIEGCTQTPCTFQRGQSYLIEVDASSRANSYTLPFEAVASILGLNVTLLSGDACDNLSAGSCPARIGDDFTFMVNFDVPTLLPPIATNVTTTLLTDFGDVGVCIIVEVLLR